MFLYKARVRPFWHLISEWALRKSNQDRSAHLRREFFATKPTGFTRLWRVLFPYQVWRFVAINIKMIRIISRNHSGH